MDNAENKSGSLAPYTILDLCSDGGSLCSKWLADLGAEVIKIDAPHDDSKIAIDTSVHWRFMNMGKKSITLDLELKSDQEKFRLLARQVDAVIESHPTGWMDERGIGFDALRKETPGSFLPRYHLLVERAPMPIILAATLFFLLCLE